MITVYPTSKYQPILLAAQRALVKESALLDKKLQPLFTALKEIQDEQILKNIEGMELSLQKFSQVCHAITPSRIQELCLDPEMIRETRRDLRAPLGTIIEYCGIIKAALKDNKKHARKKAYQTTLNEIYHITLAGFSSVEAFRVTDQLNGFFENNDNSISYEADSMIRPSTR